MGLDLGTISASVGLNTGPLAAGAVKAKAMFSGLDKSLSGGFKNAEKGIGGFGNSLKNLSGIGGSATNALGAFGAQLGVLGTVGLVAGAVVGLGVAFYSCAKEAMEAQKVTAETNAIIKTTGGVANVATESLSKLSGVIRDKTGYDDEQIQSAGNMLLTFPKVRNEVGKTNDVFDQALDLSTDMARKFGMEVPQAAKLLGKALGEPVRGVTALQRMGVMLTDSQKDQVKALVDSGNILAAQKVILGEVRTEVGLVAEAYGSTLAGKIDIAKSKFGDLKETLGEEVLPVVTKGVGILASTIQSAADIIRNAKKDIKGGWIAGSDLKFPEVPKFSEIFKGMEKGAVAGLKINVDKTELDKTKDEINNLGKEVPEIVLRFRDVGLAGTTKKDITGMIKMMADYEPAMRESGVKMFKGLMDAEAYSHPQIAEGMNKITSSMTDKIMGMPTGQLTQAKLNEIVQAEIAANPECAAEMTSIMQILNSIIAGTPLTPNVNTPTVSFNPEAFAANITGRIQGWFSGSPSSPQINSPRVSFNPESFASNITSRIQGWFSSHPSNPVVGPPATNNPGLRYWTSGEAAGAHVAGEVQAGMQTYFDSNAANPVVGGMAASGGSAMSDLAAATALANASFGNFITAMTAEPLNEVNDAIMRLTANNSSSLGDWWKLRGAYDAATASLANYEKQIDTAEKAVTSLEGKIEKANKARDAAHDRPSLLMDKQSNELQLKIMKAEDAHNYALAAKLTLEQETLDRKKEELGLVTSIADQAKEIADNPLMKDAKGKVMTVAQIDALIAKYAGQLTAKEKEVAALKITYEKVQVSVDKFKKIIDDLSAYFTSKSPAPTGYAEGTTYVPRTGMALVHQGEQIIPKNLNPLATGRGQMIQVTSYTTLDGKVLTKTVSRHQGGQANSRAMSGGRY